MSAQLVQSETDLLFLWTSYTGSSWLFNSTSQFDRTSLSKCVLLWLLFDVSGAQQPATRPEFQRLGQCTASSHPSERALYHCTGSDWGGCHASLAWKGFGVGINHHCHGHLMFATRFLRFGFGSWKRGIGTRIATLLGIILDWNWWRDVFQANPILQLNDVVSNLEKRGKRGHIENQDRRIKKKYSLSLYLSLSPSLFVWCSFSSNLYLLVLRCQLFDHSDPTFVWLWSHPLLHQLLCWWLPTYHASIVFHRCARCFRLLCFILLKCLS